jgi:signal transduction histidine kinase
MPSDSFTDGVAVARRRFTHLAVLRGIIALGYLLLQILAWAADGQAGSLLGALALCAYAGGVLAYRRNDRLRRAQLALLAADLLVMVLLVLRASGSELAIPLLLFYFLVVEAALLHGPREVLAVTAISVLFFSAWVASGEPNDLRFSFGSFLFMLVVGGALGYYFTHQAQQIEKKISSELRQAAGQSEADMVVRVERALRGLASSLSCSRAVLAFWDSSSDYYAVCQYPPEREGSDAPPVEFDQRQEWACLAGMRLDFHSNDVSQTDASGDKVEKTFDLHPFAVQHFEMYNAVGAAISDGGKPLGRLLLINRVGGVRASLQSRLAGIAPQFVPLVRHLLVVRRTEQEAYERERIRIAHDLHDGPLQSVISFEMRLQIIRRLRERDPEMADKELASLYDLSRRLVQEMRTFVHRMRPIETDDSSLGASMRRLVEGFQKESGVAVTMLAEQNGSLKVSPKLSSESLKIAREALHNIYKHSRATHVLFAVEKKGDELHVSVDDNGAGYSFGGRFTMEELDALQLGPRSIKQRVRSMGGAMTLESNPGHGSNLRVVLPIDG